MKISYLEPTVFITGGAIMMLELTGSRVLSPYAGTSIFVWTNLIGIILASLSIGYFLGGKFADKNPSPSKLSWIIFLSGALILISVWFRPRLLSFFIGINNDSLRAMFSALILFAPTSVFLGAVSPYAIRLKTNSIDTTGATAGSLYAVSTVGSIAGTFATGLYLIPRFGSNSILLFLGVSLIALGAIVYPKKLLLKTLIAAVIGAALAGSRADMFKKNNVAEAESAYNRIWIFNAMDPATFKPARYLLSSPYDVQSMMFLDDNDLAAPLYKFFRLGGYFNPSLRKTLMIGGAGYSYPKDFIKNFPAARMDVVEIDQKMTDLASAYFNLRPDQRLSIFTDDARMFVNKTKNKYDAIFLDAFHGCDPPAHLTTKEFIAELYNLLNEKGVVLANVPAAFDKRGNEFLGSENLTYKSVFPFVYLFRINPRSIWNSSEKNTGFENVMLLASKQALNLKPRSGAAETEFDEYLTHLMPENMIPANGSRILTDDYAPVEYYFRNCEVNSSLAKRISF